MSALAATGVMAVGAENLDLQKTLPVSKQISLDKNVDVVSSRSLAKSVTEEIINVGAVRVKKLSVPAYPNKVLNPELRSSRKAPGLADGFVLSEDFESWDGVSPSWLPAGWKVENTLLPQGAAGWKITQPHSPYDLITSKCMTFEMWDGNAEASLITPEFEVAQGMQLSWSTMTSPYFYDFDYFDSSTYQLTEFVTINDIKVKISTDGGASWQTLFSHAESLKKETDGNFFAMFDYTVRPFTLSLSDFAGKKAIVAFEVSGIDGNTTFIDDVSVGLPLTKTSYVRPFANLFMGLSDKDENVPASIMVGPVFQPVRYDNSTKTANASYLWTYTDTSGETKTSTDKNLSVTYETDYTDDFSTRNNLYPFPVLRATSATTAPKEFTFSGFYQAGGRGEYERVYTDTDEKEIIDLGMTIIDPFTEGSATYADIALPYFGYNQESDRFWSEYTFGNLYDENNWNHLEYYGNLFYSPASPLVIEGVRTNAYGNVSPNTMFRADIFLLNAAYQINEKPEFSAFCTGDDITVIDRNSSNGFISLNFKFDAPVVIDKSVAPYFLIAISGFRDPENVEYFSPEMSDKTNPNNLGLGWLGKQMCMNGDIFPISWGSVTALTGDDLRVAFYIMIDGSFPWLQGEEDRVSLSPGSSASITLNSYYDGSRFTFEGLPGGVTAKAEGRYADTVVTFTADSSASFNETAVKIMAPGEEKTVTLVQDSSGVDNVVLPSERGEGVIYTLTGAKVSSEALEPGVYVMRFANGETVKFVK